jgi:hypothetical protein
MFQREIPVRAGEIVERSGFVFADVIVDEGESYATNSTGIRDGMRPRS